MSARDFLPGLFTGLPADDYHAAEGMSNSALGKLARSPYHYWAEYLNPERPKREPTAAMAAGTLAHCAVLEPAELMQRYTVKPAGIDMRTKEGKAWAAALPAGVEVIGADQMATAQAQRVAVLDVPELATLLDAGEAESSIFWVDVATEVRCKCRPDWTHNLADGRVILLDLKTTKDAAPAEFGRSVWNFGYHRQAAHYSAGYTAATGREVAAFVFGAVTSEYPFIAVPYILDDDAMQRGRDECAKLLALYARCRESGNWPAYGEGVQVLSLPAWAK